MPGGAKAFIGTSGWHYKHWRGNFYPPDLPAARWLGHYCAHFRCVEINSSFYRLPLPDALASWRDSTPAGFRFAVKGSRFLTHMKKLKDPEAGLERFLESIQPLGRKMGPVVFQLPPGWKADPPRLEAFLRLATPRLRTGFEFRDPTWHIPEVYALLRRYNAAFCIYHLAGFLSPMELTADFSYVRLHGPGGAYQGSYDDAWLDEWARRIAEWRRLRSVWIFFDNDQSGYAPRDALRLMERVARPGG